MPALSQPPQSAEGRSRGVIGQVVLSGALGPMRPVTPGATVTVTITGLGSVSFRFSQWRG